MQLSPLDAIRHLTARCRCSMCGSYRNELANKPYRLVADDGATLSLAVLTCQDCQQVRLFVVEPTTGRDDS